MWETEQSFDGKLCQEYSYQKLSKFVDWSSSLVKNVVDGFWDTVYI